MNTTARPIEKPTTTTTTIIATIILPPALPPAIAQPNTDHPAPAPPHALYRTA